MDSPCSRAFRKASRRKAYLWRTHTRYFESEQFQADEALLLKVSNQTMQALRLPVTDEVVTRLQAIAMRRVTHPCMTSFVHSDQCMATEDLMKDSVAHSGAASLQSLERRVANLEHTADLHEQTLDQMVDNSLIVGAQVDACQEAIDVIDGLGHMLFEPSLENNTGETLHLAVKMPALHDEAVYAYEEPRFHPCAHPGWLDVEDADVQPSHRDENVHVHRFENDAEQLGGVRKICRDSDDEFSECDDMPMTPKTETHDSGIAAYVGQVSTRALIALQMRDTYRIVSVTRIQALIRGHLVRCRMQRFEPHPDAMTESIVIISDASSEDASNDGIEVYHLEHASSPGDPALRTVSQKIHAFELAATTQHDQAIGPWITGYIFPNDTTVHEKKAQACECLQKGMEKKVDSSMPGFSRTLKTFSIATPRDHRVDYSKWDNISVSSSDPDSSPDEIDLLHARELVQSVAASSGSTRSLKCRCVNAANVFHQCTLFCGCSCVAAQYMTPGWGRNRFKHKSLPSREHAARVLQRWARRVLLLGETETKGVDETLGESKSLAG